MNQMNRMNCIVAVAAMLASSAAQAASITSMSGVVSVNPGGSGYVTVIGPGPLNPGDLVMVAGGIVQISYSCGKTVTVEPGAVYTVGDDAEICAATKGRGWGVALGVAAAVGGGILIFSNSGSSGSKKSGPPVKPASSQ